MQKIYEGLDVHFVLDEGMQQGRHRAAKIVNYRRDDLDTCDLIVFTDDVMDRLPPFVSKRGITHSETREKGTWHFIEELN